MTENEMLMLAIGVGVGAFGMRLIDLAMATMEARTKAAIVQAVVIKMMKGKQNDEQQ